MTTKIFKIPSFDKKFICPHVLGSYDEESNEFSVKKTTKFKMLIQNLIRSNI